MGGMFLNCENLININLTNINTSSVYNMSSMFESCSLLQSIDLSNFDTSQVYYIDKMFKYSALISLDISNFKTPNLIKMEEMFFGCSSLIYLDISNINTSQVNNMDSLFFHCVQLISLNISNFNTKNVQNMSKMFWGCISLISIDLSNMDTSSVTNMYRMFYECESLISLDISNFNTSKVKDMSNMFLNCYNLTYIDISNFDIANVKNMESMFDRCVSLLSIDLSSLDLSYKYIDCFFYECNSLTSIKFSKKKNIIYSIFAMFYKCNSLKELDLSNLNFSLVEDMALVFYGCDSLKSLDLSTIQANSVKSLGCMFCKCNSLEKINFTNFDTSLVTDMGSMFYECHSLTSLDLSSFNTHLVDDMSNIFSDCYNLKELNISSFNTSLVTNMNDMFNGCKSLISINLSNFDTSKVKQMNNMFKDCKELISLDLSTFITQNTTEINSIFEGCSNLKYINFYNFYTDNSNINMNKILYGTHEKLIICVNELNAQYLISELSPKQCIINDCSINLKQNHIKRVYDNRRCLNDCKFDEVFKYEFGSYCYDKCPKGSHNKTDNIYQCETNIYECSDNYPFLIIRDLSCTQECNCIDFFSDICSINNKNMQSHAVLITNIINGIQEGLMNELLFELINSGIDIIKIEYNTSYQITSSFNQNNKEYKNISVIKLNKYENILKEQYNISENETLIIFKSDKKIKGLLIPLIEYAIFNPNTKEKLNLNDCKNNDINISLSIPISINENILFKYEQNSSYYKDICTIYNYETETDITIYDRQREFNNKNLSLCPKFCKYNGYNFENKTVNCDCQVQDTFLFSDINDELFFKFYIKKKITNFNILKCYKLLLSKNGLINNIGCYIILLVIFFYIISGIYLYLKEFNLICNQINDILNYKKLENKILNQNNSKDDNQKFPNNELVSIKSTNDYNNKTNNFAKFKNKVKLDYLDNSFTKNINNKNYNDIIKSQLYIEYEFNYISYKEALQKDKRTYFQLYISLLKERHLLISIFNLNKDYNSLIIKLCLLLFSFVLNIIINTLFFNDSLMHKIYIDKGIYKFSNNIQNIIYSLIIVTIIIILTKRIFLTQKNILEIINENNNYKINTTVLMVLRCIIIKFVSFFIFGILLLFLFGYYLSCFCAVYKRTQIYLIKNSLICYFIAIIYPFIICLLPVTFRIIALKKPAKCLYKISQIMQLI